MTETVLKALMRLFAIITQVHSTENFAKVRAVIESYLRQLVNPERINQYLMMYDFYLGGFKDNPVKITPKKISSLSVKAILICEQVNQVLEQKQKSLVLLQLLEVLSIKENVADVEFDFIRTLSNALKFEDSVFQNSKAFIFGNIEDIPDKPNVLVIDRYETAQEQEIKHIKKQYLKGKIIFLYIQETNTFIFRHIEADDRLYLNSRQVTLQQTYIFDKGSIIHNPIIGSIHYSDIKQVYLRTALKNKIHLSVNGLEYRFINSDNGIYNVSFSEESGKLIGIMGGSGVGKSTMLNLLNGNIKPNTGNIFINGYDIHENKEEVKGIIGFIPQDDLLIEELTVFQNLYFNAKLCFKDTSEEQLTQMVNKTLTDLDLYDIRYLKVGGPLNKFISGGQRKRLNIALELIREPYILLVDEPTSGLSSTDSVAVIDLLREQTYKGTLVIANIHQPSSEIYKQFDKLLVMDKGGRTIYYGNPLEALVYFKKQKQLINADESECLTCGNVNPEQILQIIDSKEVNESGRLTGKRALSPEEWYSLYKKNLEKVPAYTGVKQEIPKNNFQIPGYWNQFKIFLNRNLLSKLTDRQYLMINLLEAPILALILGIFTKFNKGTDENSLAYIFSENTNLPVYIFMSVVVALFLGLMVSAEEIIKDRKIIKRESFLNLSRFSYLNSKVVLLVVLSLIQSFTYVIIGNQILGIKGMLVPYWMMLFSVSVFSNLLGLNISDSLKSVVSIYILIPLLLVPQLLLGGAMVKFDQLNKKISSQTVVPFIGDIMVSRWAYEALCVYQFKNNEYQKYFFKTDALESNATYAINYLIPELVLHLNQAEKNIKQNINITNAIADIKLVQSELIKILKKENIKPIDEISSLSFDNLSPQTSEKIIDFLGSLKRYYLKQLDLSVKQSDKILEQLEKQYGGYNKLVEMKQDYFNNSLADLVLNKKETSKIQLYNNQLVRKAEPVYFLPENRNGRAHLFASEKRIGNFYIQTFWFNILAIWFMTVVFYVMLQFGALKKLLEIFQTRNLKNVIYILKKLIQSLFGFNKKIT
ncbi:MAG: ATP-binding cassette domain-containing protein [Bacteroidales bacterium]|nr:ATP-binding cassette domain-containing protein [Bacteroidales bacterium]